MTGGRALAAASRLRALAAGCGNEADRTLLLAMAAALERSAAATAAQAALYGKVDMLA
jgi:hypothetical protein